MFIPGTVLMWAAFLFGLVSAVTYWLAVRDPDRWLGAARQAYVLMTVCVVLASSALMYLIVGHDFRLHYVWSYSDMSLPTHFLISTFWAGQEGSFLLWIFWGTLLGLPLIKLARHYEQRAMVFYTFTLLALLLLLLKQDPFRFHEGLTAAMVPPDGQGLNPLLQNPWMVIHPPVMFLGYASLGVPFAFAMAALWMRRWDEWTRASLPWVLLSVGTLGTAIMMGGYWAYETLGWGGYWGWDPVENASLVPWLATVALAHGMLLQRGRDRFRRINLLMASAAYLLVVYATFLTRSGVLSDFSVHSFVDLGITGWLVFVMVFFLVLTIGMFAWRWRQIPAERGSESGLSRTVFLVLAVALLSVIGLVVAFGTSAPLITRLWGEPQQVMPDFYNRVSRWLAIGLAVILGSVPLLGWQRAAKGAGIRLLATLIAAIGLTGLAFVLGARQPVLLLYLLATLFALVANVWATVEKIQAHRLRHAGGPIAHVGIALMLIAFATTGWLDREQKIRLFKDRPTEVLGYQMTFKGIEMDRRMRNDMKVEVTTPSGSTSLLRPKMWINRKSNQLVANPDIRTFVAMDLYLAPIEYDPGDGAQASGASIELSRGQPVSYRDWTFTLRSFDLARESDMANNVTNGMANSTGNSKASSTTGNTAGSTADNTASSMSVGVLIDVEHQGSEVAQMEPVFVISEQGSRSEAKAIPGASGGRLRLQALDVDNGRARVELLGLGGGVAQTATLHKGESMTYGDVRLTFDDFDLSDFDPEAGRINFGVVVQAEVDGTSAEVVPHYKVGEGGHVEITEAEIPGTGGIALGLGRIDAENGTVELVVHDPNLAVAPTEPPSLVLDVSIKPLISLVWIGTLLTLAGTLMALLLRGRDVASIPVIEVAQR